MWIPRKRLLAVSVCLTAAMYSGWASADYVFTPLSFSGSPYTQPFGINDTGQVLANTSFGPLVCRRRA